MKRFLPRVLDERTEALRGNTASLIARDPLALDGVGIRVPRDGKLPRMQDSPDRHFEAA